MVLQAFTVVCFKEIRVYRSKLMLGQAVIQGMSIDMKIFKVKLYMGSEQRRVYVGTHRNALYRKGSGVRA